MPGRRRQRSEWAWLDRGADGTPITVSQNVTVPASTTQTVQFAPASFPALTITSPQVWWPYQLGAQPLYTLGVTVAQGSTQYNSTSETFGIRTVTSYLTGSNAIVNRDRGWHVNLVPLPGAETLGRRRPGLRGTSSRSHGCGAAGAPGPGVRAVRM